jgi:hypothetical protein
MRLQLGIRNFIWMCVDDHHNKKILYQIFLKEKFVKKKTIQKLCKTTVFPPRHF